MGSDQTLVIINHAPVFDLQTLALVTCHRAASEYSPSSRPPASGGFMGTPSPSASPAGSAVGLATRRMADMDIRWEHFPSSAYCAVCWGQGSELR